MELLLLTGTFLVIMFLGMVILIVQAKNWMQAKDEEKREQIKELTRRIDETQSLFRKEVSEILSNFKQLLKKDI